MAYVEDALMHEHLQVKPHFEDDSAVVCSK
jgi:hypothetical protein